MKSICSQSGCNRPNMARTLCVSHYGMRKAAGTLPERPVPSRTVITPEQRLAAAKTEDVRGCKVWTGCRTKDGYGTLNFGGKTWLAHRFAYMATRGEIPEGQVVRHTCDNPPCINPAHLITGTVLANVHDSITRKRFANGERMPMHKLTDQDVTKIRARAKSGARMRDLATEFNVSRSYLSKLISGKQRTAPTNPPL